jgi:outer membrane protein
MKNCVAGALGLALVMVMGMAANSHAEEDYKKFGVSGRAIYVMTAEDVDKGLNSADVTLGHNVIPEVDFEYFFLKNVSTELILGVSQHAIKSHGDTIGSTWLLPPTLTFKYHHQIGKAFTPYAGVGVNATIPYRTSSALGRTKIDNSIGWALQVGVDYLIRENLYLNLDLKYINADTKVDIAGTKFDLDINPHLFGLGIGYRF